MELAAGSESGSVAQELAQATETAWVAWACEQRPQELLKQVAKLRNGNCCVSEAWENIIGKQLQDVETDTLLECYMYVPNIICVLREVFASLTRAVWHFVCKAEAKVSLARFGTQGRYWDCFCLRRLQHGNAVQILAGGMFEVPPKYTMTLGQLYIRDDSHACVLHVQRHHLELLPISKVPSATSAKPMSAPKDTQMRTLNVTLT